MTPREQFAQEAESRGLMAWLGYARSGMELALRDSMADMAERVDAPRVIEAVSRGKDRRPKLVDRPHIQNHIIITGTAQQYQGLIDAQRTQCPEVKGLASTFHAVPLKLLYSLRQWADGIEAIAAREVERYKRGEELSLFEAGEAVKVIGQRSEFFEFFEAQKPVFLRMVQAAHDKHPFAEVEIQVFGRAVPVKVDPLHVRKAG